MTKYVLVQWPDSQMIPLQSWADECYLTDDSAYFVPEDRYEDYNPYDSPENDEE